MSGNNGKESISGKFEGVTLEAVVIDPKTAEKIQRRVKAGKIEEAQAYLWGNHSDASLIV